MNTSMASCYTADVSAPASHVSAHLASRFTLPPMHWDVPHAKQQGYYFHHIPIQDYLPDGWVQVEQRGRMLLLSGYSYLALYQNTEIQEFAQSTIRRYGTGTAGSRLLAGHLDIHAQLEQKIAQLKHSEDAILFTSGYVANLATLQCLLRKDDVIFSDRQNHASIVDGCQASNATLVRFSHTDLHDFEIKLQKYQHVTRKLIVVDAVFSMEGNIAPIPDLLALGKKYGALLMVDEAHSTGVLGQTGKGIAEHFHLPPGSIDIQMGTLSKAIPASGGYIAASKEICEFLRHEARGYIYSGSLSPCLVGTALKALEIMYERPHRLLADLWSNTRYFVELLDEYGINRGTTATPIVPIIVGDNERTARIAKYCQDQGLFLNSVYPPVVPAGSSRLRISIMANHQKSDLLYAANTIRHALAHI